MNHRKLLCFSSGIKIFMKISSLDCWYELQSNFNNFIEWSQSLGLIQTLKNSMYCNSLKNIQSLHGAINYTT